MHFLQNRIELSNKICDGLPRRLDPFDDRPSLNYLRLIEGYLKPELQMFVRFFVRQSNEEFIAGFEWAEIVFDIEEGGNWTHGEFFA